MNYKTLLFLIFPFLICAQTDVQVRLVSGTSPINIVTAPYPFYNNYGYETTDAYLNTILQNHNVNICYLGNGGDLEITGEDALFFRYNGTNISSFIADLENYNTTISKVSICCEPHFFADTLDLNLVNSGVGTFVGYDSNGIVITNDAGLNTIFQNYQVTEMIEQIWNIPVSIITFEGNCNDLKNALENYTTVIDSVQLFGVIELLNSPSFNTTDFTVYPNPFTEKINFSSEENIAKIAIFAVDGKLVGTFNSTNEMNSALPALQQGTYFLEISDSNNSKIVKKIIKQ
ncbi:T9SS type A sorting domain-containing protein [Flavobacterium chuncheonense]|uniref:T9SS type A sorting domain-containing protein n=1 Tax=Flavobacterium chuncheonense TaxID=2026653 RepID=A0ABW5YJ47_9FLAO